MDFITGKVSNKLIVVGLLLSFFLFSLSTDRKEILDYLIGIAIPMLMLMPLFIIRGIGAGDIKLLAVIGGFIGGKGVFYCIIASFVIGAVISLGKILINKQFFVSFRNIFHYLSDVFIVRQFNQFEHNKKNTIHFTLPILISVLCYIGGII